jgi:O-methyltransferase involved in polyketide biosynthesis
VVTVAGADVGLPAVLRPRVSGQPSGTVAPLARRGGEDPDANVPDTQDLWYTEGRTDVADWLTEHNWQVSSVEAPELMDRYARSPQDDVEAGTPRTVFVEGKLIC